MVRVVEQDHVSRAERSRRTSGDSLRGGEPAPVLAPARPQERLQAALADGLKTCLRVDAERWAVEVRVASDHLDRSVQVAFNCGDRESGLNVVAVPMDRKLVAASFDLGSELRPALELLGDDEEDRVRARRVEEVENPRRPLRVRPVVERQRRLWPIEAPGDAG